MTTQSQLKQALKAHQQGDLKRARAAYISLLKHSPNDSEALHLLGVCEFQSGNAEAAISNINAAIAQAPNVAQYHNNLGEVLRSCGRPDAAEHAYRRALELNTDYADAHNNLALVLQDVGHMEDAAQHLHHALSLEPHSPAAAANLGNTLQLLGDLEGAGDSFSRALELAPEFSEARLAYCQLLIKQNKIATAASVAEAGKLRNNDDPAIFCAQACVAIASDRYEQAAQLLTACAALNPQSVTVQMTLGRCLLWIGASRKAFPWLQDAALQAPAQAQTHHLLSQASLDLNRLDLAHEAISTALELEPGNRQFQIQYAKICRFQDRITEALQTLQEVLDEEPALVPAILELVEVKLLTGNGEQAQELLETALTLEPGNQNLRERLAAVNLSNGNIQSSIVDLTQVLQQHPERITSYLTLTQSKKFSAKDAPVIEALRIQLESRELAPPLAATGHYALGKMLADCGQYAEAFSNFIKANELRRKQVDYHQQAHENFVLENIYEFTQQRLQQLSAFGNPSRLPIIIAGMPRSGTTLVERILASHPRVTPGGEIDALTRMIPRSIGDAPRQNFLGLALDALDSATASRLRSNYLTRLSRGHPDATRISDKTPQNFLHLGMAAGLFPRAPIIHCFRHPLATCMSLYSMDMNLGNEFSYRMDEMAHYYGLYQKIMRHWQELMPGRIYALNYERLITDFETVCRELLAFCGLDWSPQCLDFHKTRGTVLTASDWQVRQPLYASAVSSWRHYETQLATLHQALLDNGVEIPPHTD